MSQFTNKMSAEALKARQNANIEFIKSPKSGKVFFTCGNIQGYVAPSALEATSASQLDYAEIITDEGVVIPTLFAHTSNNVIKTL